jgi:putative colanic acid biosynthesis UDP-glucose lipid carrier transferase
MLPKGLLKEYSHFLAIILRLMDVSAIVIGGLAAYFYKFGDIHVSTQYMVALCVAALLSIVILQFFNIYESIRAKSFAQHLSRILQGFFVTVICLAGLAFLTKTGESFSRAWFVAWALSSLGLLILFRWLLLCFLRMMRSHGWNERRVIIFGTGPLVNKLVAALQQNVWTGFRIMAILTDNLPHATTIGAINVITTPEDINAYLQILPEGIDEVWLAMPMQAAKRVQEVLYQLRHQTITTRFFLDLYGLDSLNFSLTDLAGFPVLNIRNSPMHGLNRLIKAIEDRVFASIILLLISPLFILIAILVKLSSPGPIFYRQNRVGWNNKEFAMLKFRTMPLNAEAATGPVWAQANESRATRIGALLRKTSLDELPQFINVLKGDMSIVGPRPERLHFVEQFKDQVPRYMQKHLVKAGITGWAQVNGWRGNTSLDKRIEYDLFYIENWSFWFDMKIILLTILYGFRNKNAY